ncbi:hypothetical protein BOTBODRAFT_380754 [Botryobasidium botryosum FD-172 SS1]|uniref:Uncharacterized protein n=1 Tax=Botryobasidium botryosum (strain FD-172 SS1) TaxID=930990 RepID=A0A067N810_BOTB1|nr:hypothetical protein BOTBODRAFT_380754 [Botryobasidium botryosum FD-172 SS1]
MCPISLLTLHYDILSVICSHLISTSTLLSFTLTCRAPHIVVIPKILFARITLKQQESVASLSSFHHAIAAPGSAAGEAVQNLAITSQSSAKLDPL